MANFLKSVGRGLRHQCPNCGEGRLFGKYLKVTPQCAACGHELAQYPADDGPAYFTVLLVGHLVVAPLLFFPIVWEASPWIVLPVTLTWLILVTLTVLPRVKGGFIGALYALGVKERDAHLHTADAAE